MPRLILEDHYGARQEFEAELAPLQVCYRGMIFALQPGPLDPKFYRQIQIYTLDDDMKCQPVAAAAEEA